jgi:hypothetical protein
MKIGIYGDSYADPKKKNSTLNWIEILRLKYNNVVSYGQASSNLYYSVSQFKKTQHLFDKKILLVTAPSRIWAKNSGITPTNHRFFATPWNLQNYITFQKTYNTDPTSREFNIKLFEAAIVYMTFISNRAEDIYKQELIIKDVLSIDSDTILVPCFEQSEIRSVKGNLAFIVEKEHRAWQTKWDDVYNFDIDDLRNCHMTAENNLRFAEKIIDVIENGVPLNLNENDFVNPSLESKEFYIKKLYKEVE